MEKENKYFFLLKKKNVTDNIKITKTKWTPPPPPDQEDPESNLILKMIFR